jgi:hypothetical protein
VHVRPNSSKFDQYNDDLKLAFEYNGEQHYNFVPLFHTTERDLVKQKEHDNIKKECCKKHNVTLIVIPYTVCTDDILDYMIDQLQANKIVLTKK